MLSEFPDIKEVKIHKKFPDAINIIIVERDQFAVFCASGSQCFSIDDNGVIFENFAGDLSNNLILEEPADGLAFPLGQNVIDKNIIDEIKKVNQSLKDNFQIRVDRVVIADYLEFKTAEGWSAYFNASSDIQLQISELNALLKGEISEEKRKSLEYIYLQYKDRAYYK